MESTQWAIGESLVVKLGVTDRATGSALGGWQGRLIALEDKGTRLRVQWDSLTLKSMAPASLVRWEAWGLSWREARLSEEDVLPTAARDSEEYVSAASAALER